jgi:ABC-type branched-subunit amino acid transport system substrate-binding protein
LSIFASGHWSHLGDHLAARTVARLATFMAVALFVSACASNQPAPAPQAPVAPIEVTPRPGTDFQFDADLLLRPPHMSEREAVRIAVLLPLGAQQASVRSVANALLNAAQLALFEFGNPNVLLIPKDTRGTPSGAAGAAREAVQEGAELILGPLFSGSVSAVRPIATERNVPVIAFSTDTNVAGDGVYLLSFLPDQDVARVVDYAMLQGLNVFAGLVPQNEYGRRMEGALVNAVTTRAGVLHSIETYPNSPEAMFDPARRLANYDARKRALASEKARLRDAGDEESLAALKRLDGFETFGDVPYQAVFVPVGGNELRSVAPLLPYFDVDPRKVKFLGTGQWDDVSLGREPSLIGAWYAAPPHDANVAFKGRYARAFGRQPPRIASLGYDATSLASALAARAPQQRFTNQVLSHPDGFAGVDGIFRFLPDGRNERGLAVLEVRRNGPLVIDPAPTSFVPAPAF